MLAIVTFRAFPTSDKTSSEVFPGSDGKVREVAIGACNEHSLSCALNAHSPFFRGLNVKRLGGLNINFLRLTKPKL